MVWIDIGVNLTDGRFDRDRREVVERAVDAGVTRMIVTGTDPASSAAAGELTRQFAPHLWATAGIHPHRAVDADDDALAAIERLATQPAVVAIGETGLDFNRDFSPRPLQQLAFERQLALAARIGKPVFLHERDAFTTQRDILRPWCDQLVGGVAHCFTGDRDALYTWLDLGLYIGVTGWLCDPRRGGALRELVPAIPAERLLLETDAPYLLPHHTPRAALPVRRRNEPCTLALIAAEVARLRGMAVDELAATVQANTRRLFALDAGDQVSAI